MTIDSIWLKSLAFQSQYLPKEQFPELNLKQFAYLLPWGAVRVEAGGRGRWGEYTYSVVETIGKAKFETVMVCVFNI